MTEQQAPLGCMVDILLWLCTKTRPQLNSSLCSASEYHPIDVMRSKKQLASLGYIEYSFGEGWSVTTSGRETVKESEALYAKDS